MSLLVARLRLFSLLFRLTTFKSFYYSLFYDKRRPFNEKYVRNLDEGFLTWEAGVRAREEDVDRTGNTHTTFVCLS